MMGCRFCGAENPADAAVCGQCGRPLTVPPPQLLAQIQGVLPAEPVITTGRLPPGDEARWHELVAAVATPSPPPAAAAPEPAPAPAAAQAEREPVWAGLLMVAVILLAIVLTGLGVTPPTPAASPRPDVAAAYHLIAALPPTARVLLAWDYDPTTQGEMRLLARPLLQHLQSRRVILANVSLRPFGPAMAAAAFADLETIVPLVQPPVDLGFLPGEAAALQALALAPAGVTHLPAPARERLALAADEPIAAFDLVIEFSAETATSRQWVEQIAARQTVPLIVAASGAVAPALEPYAQTGQIFALLSGYPDALAYEALLGIPGPATDRQLAQSLALLFVVGLVVIAFVRSLRTRWT
ncbi:MAG: zinc ribbon domain-containing protein [Anaerolineae bacterium]|nr:zinc ribbon domain-containing protein [Caldilineales bacterium]MDW8269946.1 zinc ribbon domain-containing protein [Anaerolineae bacterium]